MEEGWRELSLLSLNLLHDGIMSRVSNTIFAQLVDFVIDCFHLLLRFLAGNLLLHLDLLNLGLRLRSDARLFPHRVSLLLLDLLLLFGNLQMCL